MRTRWRRRSPSHLKTCASAACAVKPTTSSCAVRARSGGEQIQAAPETSDDLLVRGAVTGDRARHGRRLERAAAREPCAPREQNEITIVDVADRDQPGTRINLAHQTREEVCSTDGRMVIHSPPSAAKAKPRELRAS